MSRKINYTDEDIGDIKIIQDFLPSPDELVFKDDSVKVTISLSKNSVDFFKQEAKKNNTKYQKMIRNLLDIYAQSHSNHLTKNSTRTRKNTRAG